MRNANEKEIEFAAYIGIDWAEQKQAPAQHVPVINTELFRQLLSDFVLPGATEILLRRPALQMAKNMGACCSCAQIQFRSKIRDVGRWIGIRPARELPLSVNREYPRIFGLWVTMAVNLVWLRSELRWDGKDGQDASTLVDRGDGRRRYSSLDLADILRNSEEEFPPRGPRMEACKKPPTIG